MDFPISHGQASQLSQASAAGSRMELKDMVAESHFKRHFRDDHPLAIEDGIPAVVAQLENATSAPAALSAGEAPAALAGGEITTFAQPKWEGVNFVYVEVVSDSESQFSIIFGGDEVHELNKNLANKYFGYCEM